MKVSVKLNISLGCEYHNCPKDWYKGIEDAKNENWRGCFPKCEECDECDYKNAWQQINHPFYEEERQFVCPLRVGVNQD